VIASDSVDIKLGKASELKADAVINCAGKDIGRRIRDLNEGRGADIVLITAPTIQAVRDAVDCAEKGGTIIQFGGSGPAESVSIVPYHFLVSELSYFGAYSSSPSTPT